jgi:hypothetical protein
MDWHGQGMHVVQHGAPGPEQGLHGGAGRPSFGERVASVLDWFGRRGEEVILVVGDGGRRRCRYRGRDRCADRCAS